MECMAREKCRLSLCKTDDCVFSVELGRRSACEAPCDLIREPLGAHNAFGCMIYSICWIHKRAAWVDLGSHGGVASQSNLRVTSVLVGKIECFVFLSIRLETLVALI